MDRTRRPIPLFLAVVVVVLALGGPATQAAPAQKPAQAIPGELLIGFRSDVSAAEQKKVLKTIGAAEKKSFKGIRGSLARVSPDAVGSALAKLRQDRRVRYAEPNAVVHIDAAANDPAYGNLWGLENGGQTINGWPGTPDADIDAPDAWARTTGSNSVTVGVIDTGVDWSHPDLASQIWTNPGENCSGCRTDNVDNDHNGYVDDWHGWDFVNDDNNPMDDHGHGTHVAGTIGAAGNNGIGITGVTWNVRIMPLKFLNAQGSGTTADAVSAILFSAENGADLTNNSWAGGEYSQALADAIAVADERGLLFVAAAGNDGSDNDLEPTYPASYELPNVISVAATSNSDDVAYFSNVGRRSVDLGAPGVDIYSTWPGGSYRYLSGTSMASPHVAGAAALLKAAFPSAGALGLKALLLDSVDPNAALAGETTTGGRLNVGTAAACSAEPKVWIDSPGPAFSVDVGAPISFSAIAASCADAGGVTVTATGNGASIALVQRGDGLYSGTYTPESRGPVTIAVTAETGGASLTRTITGNAKQAYSISPGGPSVTVTTAAAGETAEVRFNGEVGERISLAASGSTMSAAQVSLSKPGGGVIRLAFVGSSGGFIDTKTLPTTGVYSILVDPSGSATGSLTLTLYDVPGDVAGTVTPGGATATIANSIPGQNARLMFVGSPGQRISMQLSSVTMSMALVSVLKPDGSALFSSTSVGTSGKFVDTRELPSAGTYTILIDPQGAVTGSATLKLYDVPADAGGPIVPGGSPVSISTTTPGQNGRLSFEGTAGQRVSVKISSVTFSSSVSLLRADGTAVGNATSVGTGGGLLDTRSLPAAGTYTILVDPTANAIGSATLTLYDVPPDVTGSLTPGGPSLAVSTATPGQNAKVTFDGQAGQRVSLKVGPSTLSQASLSISKPDGSALVSNAHFTTSGTFVDTRSLPVAGTYTITVDPQVGATGSATLTLYDVPTDVAGSISIGGAPLSLAFATPGQNARITFDGSVGQALSLKLSDVAVASSFVSILKPDGTTLVSQASVGTSGRTIAATLPLAGIYTLVVDPQSAATGSLTLTLF
jgi:subtilisin family serine protease